MNGWSPWSMITCRLCWEWKKPQPNTFDLLICWTHNSPPTVWHNRSRIHPRHRTLGRTTLYTASYARSWVVEPLICCVHLRRADNGSWSEWCVCVCFRRSTRMMTDWGTWSLNKPPQPPDLRKHMSLMFFLGDRCEIRQPGTVTSCEIHITHCPFN